VIAYKFLADTALSRFSETRWPLPGGAQPGEWLRVSGPISPCLNGIHAMRAQHLPFWLDQQLWEIELDGALIEGESMLVAQRGRLLRRIEAWDASGWNALCAFARERCAANVARVTEVAPNELERARFFVAEVDSFLALGAYPTAVYVAAVAAHVASALAPEAAYRAERAEQARFLIDYLRLAA
jgi:hypothetical protein